MSLTALLAVLGRLAGAVAGALPALFAYLAGRRGERARAAEQTSRIHDEQLRHAADRPRDRAELVERLRSDGL